MAQALVLHIIERGIPSPVPVPGVKLGLANIISLLTIIIFGLKEALIVVTGRTFLASLLSGSFSAFFFSIAGGMLSTAVMSLMYTRFRDLFSIPVISIVGAVFHNLGQIAVASFVVANLQLFYYLPVLLVSGIITGLFIGLAVKATQKPLLRILGLKRS